MPFALIVIGLILIVTGSKNTHVQFGQQVVKDFTGSGNFTYWLAAIGGVGALGYIPEFKGFSRAFMALILISMILKNGGVFDKFKDALAQGPIKPTATAASGSGATATASTTPTDAASVVSTAIKYLPLVL